MKTCGPKSTPKNLLQIRLEICDAQDKVKVGRISDDHESDCYAATGVDLVTLGIKKMRWQEGDQIKVTLSQSNQYLWVQLDEALAPTLIYVHGTQWVYQVPLAPKLMPGQPDTIFGAQGHYLVVRRAENFEVARYQNLAVNTHDQPQATNVFPHAYANVETRGESVFLAKNAIDGKLANLAHGEYPFQSWGINRDLNAELTVYFGRLVELDCVKLLFRGDYPHDSFWKSIVLEFSDHQELALKTTNDLAFQCFDIGCHRTEWLKLKNLQQATDSSPFPALTQVEAYGYNLNYHR